MSYGDWVMNSCPDTVYTLEPNAGHIVATAMVMMFIVGCVFGGSLALFGKSCIEWLQIKALRQREQP